MKKLWRKARFPFIFVTGLLLEGIVTMYLWNWFVSSTLIFPKINIWTGIGISILATHLTFSQQLHLKKRTSQEKFDALLNSSVARLFCWGTGFVVYCLSTL